MSDIHFEGLEEVLNSLENVVDLEKLEAVIGKACAIVEAEAKKKAPKDKGGLARSISSKVDGVKGVVYTPLAYAPYVEFGTGLFAENGGRTNVPWCYQDAKGEWHSTSGMKPQPFMRPALNESREKVIRVIKEGITNND